MANAVIRTFKYVLRPNVAQRATLESWLVLCQRLYNAALEQRIYAWGHCRRGLTLYEQQKDLTELRQADETYRLLPALAARSALRRLDLAFKAFFRRCKTGETPGFPRFRSRDRYDSFAIGPISPNKKHVRVPNLGLVRVKFHRELRGTVKNTEIKRVGKKWHVCFQCDIGSAPAKRPAEKTVGFDLGLKEFLVLSTGEAVSNPRWFRSGEELLAKRQRVLARRCRGSASRRRARALVSKAYSKIKNQRRDHHWKLANRLVREFDLIAHEDLNIRGLARAMLAKSVADASWGQFLAILACKAEEAGVTMVAVDPRGTSQRCCQCGASVPKTLGERTHRCECGYVADRDLNAAKNVHALGLSAVATSSVDVARSLEPCTIVYG